MQVRTNTSFFLHPGESLLGGVQCVHVLAEEEALLLTASEAFTDEEGKLVPAGSRWMLHGPCDYIPPIQARMPRRVPERDRRT